MIDRRKASGVTAPAGILVPQPSQAVDTNCANYRKTSDLSAGVR
jgi:hypothetical protein